MTSDIATLMVMAWEISNENICKFGFSIWKKHAKTILRPVIRLWIYSCWFQVIMIMFYIFLRVISCLIINAYNECFYKYAYSKHSINLYHPIDPKCFKKLDHTWSYFVELLSKHGLVKGGIIIIVVNLQVVRLFYNKFNNLGVKAKPLANPLPPIFFCFTSFQ